MPHGYECDRCGEFVEQDQPFGREMLPDLDGSVEEVHIANPNLQSDRGPGVERYTLCDGCRSLVIKLIECKPSSVVNDFIKQESERLMHVKEDNDTVDPSRPE